MKRKCLNSIFALLLAGAMLLTSCNSAGSAGGTAETTAAGGTQDTACTSTAVTTNTSQTSGTAAKPEYADIECESAKNFTYINFVCGESTEAINIGLPEEWKVYSDGENGYNVLKYGKEIGKVYLGGESELDEGKTELYSDVKTNLGIETRYSINRYGEAEYTYRKRIAFKYADGGATRTLTLDVDFAAIDDAGVRSIRGVPHTWEIVKKPELGNLSFSNKPKNILILGNSFVSTSRIGQMLLYLCAEEEIGSVTAVSLPNVSAQDYASSSYWLAEISSGVYNILFLNGFYSITDVTELEKIISACKQGGVQLVLMPAHNETFTTISSAKAKYPDIVMLDWRDEINSLIYSGISKEKFCMDDGPEHSTPLAGYVGAAMIYRSLFGKMPTAPIDTDYCGISQATVNRLLGDYVKTGVIYSASPSKIYFFDE